MRRLPLRVRLVAGFSAAMFVVLLAAGAFVYSRVHYALDRGLDSDLARATETLTPLVGPTGTMTNRASAEATGVAWQVLGADGTVLDHGGPAGSSAMVSTRVLREVDSNPSTVDVGDLLPASKDPYRVQIVKVSGTPTRYVLVGVRRDHRDEALRELLLQLALAGFGALLVTGFVGERLARAALRPVERYRRQAADIAAGATDLRLQVPATRDDEVTRLGHTFNDMLASLERSLDRERQFVNEASHELRTPVTLIGSRIQLARRRSRSVTEHERILDELQVDVDRLADLAEDLLQLGSAGARTGTGDLATIAARVVDQRRVVDPRHAVEVSLSSLVSTLRVALDELAIERILTNLLDNASAHGAPPHDVRLDHPDPSWARLQVTDGGDGMPPDLLATATRRFTRAGEARSRPGAGLGLALVASLTVSCGGELRLCFDGHHVSHGLSVPVPCVHGPAMTATVLLPTA
ncbi:sensor histidine kinase [Nocardioides sp. Root151]|uniref:sensor histidine kinase n=1 Tax=Nocardioides sp. Root151 TaxID=1736475 RepID=UPI000702DC34|nr:HAMP domain-containing sensor histidine kinase [Nocardioides sp. Root151]KQZ70785.1 histidine kinase [Nocardioides sp. Root151]